MRSVIVNHQVQLQIGGEGSVEPSQELEEFLVAVTGHAVCDDLPGQDMESRKQRGRPVALVIMGQGSTTSLLHGKTGLSALQGLNLTFLVHTQHDRLVRRIEIKSNHIGEFFHKALVAREFKRLDPVRL